MPAPCFNDTCSISWDKNGGNNLYEAAVNLNGNAGLECGLAGVAIKILDDPPAANPTGTDNTIQPLRFDAATGDLFVQTDPVEVSQLTQGVLTDVLNTAPGVYSTAYTLNYTNTDSVQKLVRFSFDGNLIGRINNAGINTECHFQCDISSNIQSIEGTTVKRRRWSHFDDQVIRANIAFHDFEHYEQYYIVNAGGTLSIEVQVQFLDNNAGFDFTNFDASSAGLGFSVSNPTLMARRNR